MCDRIFRLNRFQEQPAGQVGGKSSFGRIASSTIAAELANSGAIVEEAILPKLDFHADLGSGGELIGMMLGTVQPESQEKPVTLARYFKALARRDESIVAWEQFFQSWDALLCPRPWALTNQ